MCTLKQTKGQIELFKLDHGRYPERLEDLRQRPESIDPDRWPKGGYLEEAPIDAWGRPLHYAFPGTRGAFDLFSLGADGKEGGEGEDEDLWSRPPR
jgi:general secretion pathway protein G